jgi:hypothetical protein
VTCYIRELSAYDAPWRYAVTFDFSIEMVESIKATIPSRSRCWKPDRKEWWVKAAALDVLLALADRHCGGWEYGEREQPTPAPILRPADALAVLHLTQDAPAELIPLVYRFLAKRLHPDRGGNTEAMQRVNAAYALLSKRA